MTSNNYNADSIIVLKGLEAVRVRPGMYIGDLSYAAYQMLLEAVDNSVDEYSAGYANEIYITINDESFIIKDNGRGIPIDKHESGSSALEIILTVLHSGGKFNTDTYQYSGGLHGVGISVVNALSDQLIARVFRNNKIYEMCFSKGIKVSELEIVGESSSTGTEIIFIPDWSIVEKNIPSYELVSERLEQLSYLNKNLKIMLNYNGKQKVFFSEGGIKDFLKSLNKEMDTPILIVNKPQVQVAFAWQKQEKEDIRAFTNNIYQADGGTHVTGFRQAITDEIMHYLPCNNIKSKIIRDDIKSALIAIISVKINEPQFSSQTKTKLVSPNGRIIVSEECKTYFRSFLEENPAQAKIIIDRIEASAELRIRLNNRKEDIKLVGIDYSTMLAGKLVDCSSNKPEECELLIVEGSGAAGTAKLARNKKYQAIFPIQGKLLNVERANNKQIYDFEEIKALTGAIGAGWKDQFNPSKLRYHKIIIMVDADADGYHISTLLFTFFIKFMPELVKKGHLYISKTPLYKVTYYKQDTYLQYDNELEIYIANHFLQNNIIDIKITVNELLDLLQKIKNFNAFLSNFIISSEIIALYCSYSENFSEYAAKYYNCEANIIEDKLYIRSIYGEQMYIMPDISMYKDMYINFRISVNNKTYYDVISFLKVFYKLSMQGLSIQRYKGLGEMNADELAQTSVHPDTRTLIQMTYPEDQADQIEQDFASVMGYAEEDRREFILSNIG